MASAFVACTGGVAAGIVLGLSDAAVKTVVVVSFGAGIIAGTTDLVTQTISSSGEYYDYSEIINSTVNGSIDGLIDGLLLESPLKKFIKTHPVSYVAAKALLTFTVNGIIDRKKETSLRKINENDAERFITGIFQIVWEYIKYKLFCE